MTSTHSFFVIHDTTTKDIVDVSKSIEEEMGWRPDQIIGTSAWNYTHPDDQISLFKAAEAFHKNYANILLCIYRFRNANGKFVWVKSRIFRSVSQKIVVTFTAKLYWWEHLYWELLSKFNMLPKHTLIGTGTEMMGASIT